MANYMFVLRPTEKKYRVVCPDCAKRGEVLDSCKCCCGVGVIRKSIKQYYVQDRPIEIEHTDRDPKTGILRYWENKSEFFYETVTASLNNYVPDVPYGVHLCHDTRKFAEAECERINKYLSGSTKQSTSKDTFSDLEKRLDKRGIIFL